MDMRIYRVREPERLVVNLVEGAENFAALEEHINNNQYTYKYITLTLQDISWLVALDKRLLTTLWNKKTGEFLDKPDSLEFDGRITGE
jgi:hypothetical protein